MKFKRLLLPLALVLALAFLLAIGALVLDRIASLPGRAVKSATSQMEMEVAKVREAFNELFRMQPEVKVSEKLVCDQTASTPELVMVSREVEVTRDARHTWWGSTKTIRMRARYKVRAGFDLSQKFEVQVGESEIAIDLPRAKILGLEPTLTQIEELQDGLWNKIQAGDIEKELNKMPEIAKQKSEGLKEEAEKTVRQLLAQKMADRNFRVNFIPEPAAVEVKQNPDGPVFRN